MYLINDPIELTQKILLDVNYTITQIRHMFSCFGPFLHPPMATPRDIEKIRNLSKVLYTFCMEIICFLFLLSMPFILIYFMNLIWPTGSGWDNSKPNELENIYSEMSSDYINPFYGLKNIKKHEDSLGVYITGEIDNVK